MRRKGSPNGRLSKSHYAKRLSVKQWCQQEGIAKSAFYMRRSRLKLNHAKLKIARIEPTVRRSKALSVRSAFIYAGVL
jgi:hypothetical protein